jgi:hypothetical protein
MSDNPMDIIEAALRSAFVAYPREDGPDWRSPSWIKPEQCTHLAQGIVLELQAKGFEIVKRSTRLGFEETVPNGNVKDG